MAVRGGLRRDRYPRPVDTLGPVPGATGRTRVSIGRVPGVVDRGRGGAYTPVATDIDSLFGKTETGP
jgi:hypothetical protein